MGPKGKAHRRLLNHILLFILVLLLQTVPTTAQTTGLTPHPAPMPPPSTTAPPTTKITTTSFAVAPTITTPLTMISATTPPPTTVPSAMTISSSKASTNLSAATARTAVSLFTVTSFIDTTMHSSASASTGIVPSSSNESFTATSSATLPDSPTSSRLTSAMTSPYMLNTTFGPLTTEMSTPLECEFSELCINTSVYYWMVGAVEAIGDLTIDESTVKAWLQDLFHAPRHKCLTQSSTLAYTPGTLVNTVFSSAFTSPPVTKLGDAVTPLSPDTETASHSSNLASTSWVDWGGNEGTAASIFQELEVSCDKKSAIRRTKCTVLLSLRQPPPPCCILHVLDVGQANATFSFRVVGNNVERVAKGECLTEGSLPPDGSFEKCNSSLPLSTDCNPNVTASCNGNSKTVYVSMATNGTVNCNAGDQKNKCNCSSYCNSTDAYYTLAINITDSKIKISSLHSTIDTLATNPKCNITSPRCQVLKNVSLIYKESWVGQCQPQDTNLRTCQMIVRLQHAVEICTVRAALLTAFKDQPGLSSGWLITRAAICGWVSEDPLKASLSFVKMNLSPDDVCQVNSLVVPNCRKGGNVCVLLNERCSKDPTVDPLPTTLGPNSTVTPLPNITSTLLNTIETNKPNISSHTTPTAQNLTSTGNTTVAANASVIPPVVKPTGNSSVNASTASPSITVPLTTVAESAEAQALRLLEQSRNAAALNVSQVEQLVSQLEQLLSGPNISLILGTIGVKIVSNLLNASTETLTSTSKRIIMIVDTIGLRVVVSNQNEIILSDSLGLAVQRVDGAEFQQTSFTVTDASNLQIGSSSNRQRTVTALASSIPQGSITLPASITANLTTQQQQLLSRVQFNFYQRSTVFQDSALGQRKLNSGILGASAANLSISGLQENVTITLRNIEPVPANFVASCVFWDFALNDGSGGWSADGCSVLNSTDEETICACTHLTSFAILLDISRESITSRLQSLILTYITYIGCGISAIFLSVTLLTYLAFGKLRKDIPSKILIQLCLALLMLNLVFLLDAWLALYPDTPGLCISTAFFLHYFLLAAFTWMAVEAVHMYLALVRIFNIYIARFMVKMGFAGWGIPLVVVIIVIAIDKNNYGLVSYGRFDDGTTDDFCWLRNDIAFYVAVVAYFCVVFLFNMIILVVVMVQLCRMRQNPHNVQRRSVLQDLRSVASLTVLLCITWGFAFFAWGPVNLAFMYLFAIFNSLQGFLIFVFHCAMKEKVRRQWRTYLCCGKLRLAGNLDWSQTATQKIKKRSSTHVTSFRSSHSSQSNNSSSSTTYLVSDSSERPQGFSSPLEDRMITSTESNADVVQNELNRQYRTQTAQ